MKSRFPVCAALAASLALLATWPLRAALISYDGADYPANSTLNTRNGGLGWLNAWSGLNRAVADGLQFPGLVTAANRLLTVGGNQASLRTISTAGFSSLLTGGKFGLDGTELWLSVLARRETNQDFTEYAGLSLFDGGTEELFLGIPSGGFAHWGMQLFDLGAAPGNITAASYAPVTTGETVFLVLRLRFAASDTVDLFVNPTPGVVPTRPDATRSGANIRFDRIRIQSGPYVSQPPLSLDEIRLGESYADVAPGVPGPAIGWLRSGSQRVTVGAEVTLPFNYSWPGGDVSTLGLAVTVSDSALLPESGIFVYDTGPERLVRFRPPAGAGGTCTITATVTPPGGAAVSASFDLVILPTPPEGLLAYEPFDYAAGASLDLANGGQGFAGTWTRGIPGTPPASSFVTTPTNLPYPSLATSGRHVRMATTGGTALKRTMTLPLGEDGTVRYLSVLVRPDGTPAASAYLGFRLLGSLNADLFVGKPGGGSAQRYVLENAGGTRQVATAQPVTPNTVSLLVLKLEFFPGIDRISLFVNPPPGIEPAVAAAVKQNLDLGLVAGLALNSAATWSVDELRLGTTWASVTPPAASADFQLRQLEPTVAAEKIQFRTRVETVVPLPAGITLVFELTGPTFGASIDAVSGEVTWVPGEEDGDQTRPLTVRATSSATPPVTRELTFNVVVFETNLQPQLAPVNPQAVDEGASLSYQLVATDADLPAQELSYFVVSGPPGLSASSTGLLTWTPTAGQFDHSFPVTVKVVDPFSATAEQSFTLTSRPGPGAGLLGALPPAYRLPEMTGETNGGCFIARGARINLSDDNWSGGHLRVELAAVPDGVAGLLELRPNADISVTGPLEGDFTVSFRDSPFGTAQLAGNRLTCDFTAAARKEAIVALLGRLFYGNTELTADWFTVASARYPRHTLEIVLTDGTGNTQQDQKDIGFPYLIGIGLGDPLGQALAIEKEGRAPLNLRGVFSNGQILLVPWLATEWSASCGELLTGKPGDAPGQIEFERHGNSCCEVTAKAGALVGRQILYFELCVLRSILPPVCEEESPANARPVRQGQPNAPAEVSLSVFHALESLMQETSEGRRLATLYWRHTAEVVRILATNPGLFNQTKSVIKTFQLGVSALLASKAGEVVITQAMIDELNTLWDGIAGQASSALKTALQEERARFNGFQSFANQDFAKWAELLTFPVPAGPAVFLSAFERDGDQVRLEVNDVPGLTLTLRRSLDLKTWEAVPNADRSSDGFTLRFIDPTPPASGAFYMIGQ